MKRAFSLVVFSLLFSIIARAVPISGQVVGPDGAPVADAQVFFQSVAPKASKEYSELKTDAGGEFSLDAQPYSLSTDFFGRVLAYKDGLALGGATLHKTGNVVRLEKAGQIGGRVVDKKGEPVADAVVALYWTMVKRDDGKGEYGNFVSVYFSPLQERFRATTDADGRWKMDGLPAGGEANVSLTDPRFVKVDAKITIGQNAEKPLIARPAANVEGRVVFPDGRPAPDVQVMAQGQDNNNGWAQATTDKDGKFLLTGLPNGSFNVSLDEPSKEWTAAAHEGVGTQEGKTLALGDFKLTRGALIEGFITDAQTKEPIAGAHIGVHGPHHPSSSAQVDSATSDAKGHYQLRVPPGKTGVYVMGAPEGYLAPDDASPRHLLYVEIVDGQTKNLSFALQPAPGLSGVAVDENEKTVAGASLSLVPLGEKRDYLFESPTAQTGKDGAFDFKTLGAGEYKARAAGGWEIVSPETVTLPFTGKLRVVLRPLPLRMLTGRARTPDGKPIASVGVVPWITPAHTEQGETFTVPNPETLLTDEAGQFALNDLRPDFKVSLTAKKSGYRFVSGGAVTAKDGQFAVSDFVFEPLSFQISGQVVDKDGRPIPGAAVLSPDGQSGTRAQSDEKGRFTLGSLSGGAVLLVAFKDQTIGQTRADTTKTDDAKIVLDAPSFPKDKDLWGAQAILQEALLQVKDNDEYERAALPTTIAPYDPDLALQMATDVYGHVSDSVLSKLVVAVSERDPVRALMWAPAQLERITTPFDRATATLEFARTIAPLDPDLAGQYFEKGEKEWRDRQGIGAEWQQLYTLWGLARLAGALKRDDAQSWFDQAFNFAAKMPDDDHGEFKRLSVEMMAPYFPLEAEKLAVQLPETKVFPPGWIIAQIIKVLAPADTTAAQRLLARIKERSDVRPEMWGVAQRDVAVSLAKTDAAAALQLARGVSAAEVRAQALVRVAPFSPQDERAEVFREAFNAANQSGLQARIAALTFQTDPALGRELFEEVKERAPKIGDEWGYAIGARAAIAFYISRADPVGARAMLEEEYALRREKGGGDQGLGKVARAMVAVDAERAVEIARSMPVGSDSTQAETIRKIAQYLLASDEVRATMPFDRWGASDTWTPGEDENW